MLYNLILNLWIFATSVGILVLSLVFLPYAYDQFRKRFND